MDMEDRQEIIGEIADVIYHILVLMADQDITLEDVQKELVSRRG